MKDLRSEQWDASYARKENHIQYPKEEVVKFLSRHVRRKVGRNTFVDVLSTSGRLRGLDLGCGIGRQTVLLEEFGIHAHGVDISANALVEARAMARELGYAMDDRFLLLTDTQLPFDAGAFDIAVVDSVLDSMEFAFARQYMHELDRTVDHLVYISLIAVGSHGAEAALDAEVTGVHEHNTIQGYYDAARVEALISGTNFTIRSMYRTSEEDMEGRVRNARYHIILHKQP
ncbi:MAG: class I SAM-dependent methyltransferase [Flavobacteriales bacterium]|nr:class I SAM-dependent methyltransferase [Flavobacteriales bacterium]